MNNLNSVLIEGNIVRDPEYRTTNKGTGVCKFTVASNRYYKQENGFEKEVGFFDVEAWGKISESVNTQARKGRGVRVVGRLKQERWQNKEGNPMSRVVIVADHVEYRAEFKKDSAEAEEENAGEEYATTEEKLVPSF
jgi:single-strand DNA-binding protein